MAMPAHQTKKLLLAEQITGYTFRDLNILWEALQAGDSGIFTSGDRHINDGNKRIALLSDRVAELVLTAQWYDSGDAKVRYSHAQQALTTNASLGRAGRAHHLFAALNMNTLNPIPKSDDVVGTLVEAVLGAIWKDSHSTSEVRGVMYRLGLDYGEFVESTTLGESQARAEGQFERRGRRESGRWDGARRDVGVVLWEVVGVGGVVQGLVLLLMLWWFLWALWSVMRELGQTRE